MRELLGLPAQSAKAKKSKEEKPVGGVQVTFSAGLASNEDGDGKKRNIFENDPAEMDETTVETYVRKERERKQKRKDRLKASREGITRDDEDAEPDDAEEGNNDDRLGFDDPFTTRQLQARCEKRRD